jgi:SAM-dependent methyltransferase
MNTPEPAWSSPVPGTAAGRAVSNPFDSDPVARRYAHARPYYHHWAIRLAAGQLGICHARLAVDVACGTGLSTRAVLQLADHVVAIDASAAMLRAAQPHSRARYLVAAAERIPLRDAAADLATVGAAFHWFDQQRAFTELARVLRSGGGLAVYTDFFHGELSGQPAFATWLKEAYLPRYPAPPRHAYFDPAAAPPAGFGDASHAEDDVRIPLTCTQLADYLLSQSNAATAIETGAISEDTLRNQILDETAAFFPRQGPADALFGIRVWTTVRRDEHRGTP